MNHHDNFKRSTWRALSLHSLESAASTKSYGVLSEGPRESPANPEFRIDSVYLLHLRGLVSCAFHLLKGWKVIIIAEPLVIIINAETQLDHAVDAACELCGLIEVEA